MAKAGGFADQSVAKTYRRLRYLVSAVLIALPLVTATSGFFLGSQELQPSLSDYYFVEKDGGLPRALFLIFLAALGCVPISYPGLDEKDALIHNAAGICSLGVALFPMHCDVSLHKDCVPGLLPILHLPFAGLLYLCAVISVIYGGGPKIRAAFNKLPGSAKWHSKLRKIQFVSAT